MSLNAEKKCSRSAWGRRSGASFVTALAAGLVGALLAAEAVGTTFDWNNSLGGDFGAAGNWTPAGGPPDSAFDTAIFDLFAIYDVEFFDDFTNGALEVVSPGVTLDLFDEDPMFEDPTSYSYSLSATLGTAADVSSVPGSLIPAVLTVTGGDVNAGGSLYIGRDATTSGQLNLEGGALWDSTAIAYVGFNGDGTLVFDAGSMDSSEGRIGWGAGSSGTVTAHSRWTISGDLTVGGLGNGSMMTFSNADVSNAIGVIAVGAGSTSSVTVNSFSTWTNTDALYVGGNSSSAGGDGTLTIDGQSAEVFATNTFQVWPTGTVTIDRGSLTTGSLTNLGDMTLTFGATVSSPTGVIGDETATVGNATVQLVDPNTAWTMTGDLHVGGRDTSDLTISSGAAVSNVNAFVAVDPLASANITLTQAGAQWTSSGSAYLRRRCLNSWRNRDDSSPGRHDHGRCRDPQGMGQLRALDRRWHGQHADTRCLRDGQCYWHAQPVGEWDHRSLRTQRRHRQRR